MQLVVVSRKSLVTNITFVALKVRQAGNVRYCYTDTYPGFLFMHRDLLNVNESTMVYAWKWVGVRCAAALSLNAPPMSGRLHAVSLSIESSRGMLSLAYFCLTLSSSSAKFSSSRNSEGVSEALASGNSFVSSVTPR